MSSVTETSTSALGKQGEMFCAAPDRQFVFHARAPSQRIRVREAFASLTRLGGYGASRSFGSFGQELIDVLVSVVALTDFHQTGKMEFHPSFDLTRWNVRLPELSSFKKSSVPFVIATVFVPPVPVPFEIETEPLTN
jgi:hypothetical protein